MNDHLLVITLGGNAIKQADEQGTTEEQFRNVDRTARQVPAQTLAVCGAISQGQIGWMLQNRLA